MSRTLLYLGLSSSLLAACASTPREGEGVELGAEQVERSCARAQGELSPSLVAAPLPQRNALAMGLDAGEALMAVRYTGCELEVLRGCTAPGGYVWQAQLPQSERRSLYSVEELLEQFPLAALGLAATMQHYRSLHLTLASAGRYVASGSASRAQLSGSRCEEATHLVAEIVVGAYELSSRMSVSVDVSVDTQDVEIEGSSRHQEDYFSNEGSPATCHEGVGEGAEAPARDCASFVGLELRALEPTDS